MFKMREIPFFKVENDFGGDQHKLDRFIMRKGGCAAVTACDCSIYFELYKNIHGLYPYDVKNISYKNYRQFSEIMMPYLRPRMMGINKLETYIDGFKKFLVKRGITQINFTAWHGEENISDTITKVKSTLDAGFPIPCLTLEHKNPDLKLYVWHWFLFTGYDDADKFFVKVTTYGESKTIDLAELWDTGFETKGGLILFDLKG